MAKSKSTSRRKKGERPPTTSSGSSRESGRRRDEAVSVVPQDQSMIRKAISIGMVQKKTIISIGARMAAKHITEEEAQAEVKVMLRQASSQTELYALENELVDFTAYATLCYRKMAGVLIPQARKTLQSSL